MNAACKKVALNTNLKNSSKQTDRKIKKRDTLKQKRRGGYFHVNGLAVHSAALLAAGQCVGQY